MPIIVKNAGSTAASVQIVEISTQVKDSITIMPSGKVTLKEGWDVAPTSVLTNPKLVIHRSSSKAPAPPTGQSTAKPAVKTTSTTPPSA